MLSSTSEVITKQSLMTLHKLDSFIRETQRLYPNNFLSSGRYVCVDTVLSDGTFLPKGTSIATPLYAISRDPAIFMEPEKFDPERFERLREEEESGGSRKGANPLRWSLTNVDPRENMNFGFGRHACPGRFLAASEVCFLSSLPSSIRPPEFSYTP